MKRYRYVFEFFKTEEEANMFADRIMKGYTPYMRKTRGVKITPWTPSDGKGDYKFVAWYYV